MDFISLLSSATQSWPNGFWESIIKFFDFIGNYAWTIIIFTICLKFLLSPLDFLQRYFTNKTTRAQAKLAPQLEKLKKQYGQNQNLLYQKQNELYKKSGTSMKGSCVVMIVYMALTLTIFMTLWQAMGNIASFKIKAQYNDLQATYYQTFDQDYYVDYLGADLSSEDYLNNKETYILALETDKASAIGETGTEEVAAQKALVIDNAQNAVFIRYDEIKDDWLWIKNIWRSDTSTSTAILNYADFSGYDKTVSESTYNLVMKDLLNDTTGVNGVNGYYILSFIVLCSTFFSQWLTKKMSQRKGQEQQSKGPMKALMFILPVIMVIFTLSSSAIFAIYIITNSITTTLIMPFSIKISNKIEDKIEKQKAQKVKVDYRR